MIYILTSVAITQAVLLGGTFFFRNTGQKDKATFMNKNILIALSYACRNLQKSSSTTQLNNES